MPTTKLEKADVENLQIFVNACDLRRDLHSFARYVSENEIKRAHRDNTLPKAHLKRIAKLMTDTSVIRDVNDDGYSLWIDYIDRLSLKLGFVDYQTEGTYMGYSSQSESYPDNYIDFSDKTYENFLNQSLQKQEDDILNVLVHDAEPCDNEFFKHGPLSMLDRFDGWGCATGTMTQISFLKTRTYLLELLSNCEAGVWYSTASLIEYVENNNPFFLIPEKLSLKKPQYDEGLYHNFIETKTGSRYGKSWGVENLKDRFQRVEGRFIERFLEGIPLNLGYVDAAYSEKREDNYPSLNRLQAFRVTDRLLNAINGSVKEPEITVLPNYEIHIDSLLYPAKALDRLFDLCDVVIIDIHSVLKLSKKKVIEQLAVHENLNVIGLLKRLSVHEIPGNVKKEIATWAEHADNFIVYRGFGLLEGDMDRDSAGRFVSVAVAPDINIILDPETLHKHLEKAGKIPVYVNHSDSSLKSLQNNIQSRFARKNSPKKRKAQKINKYTLKRTVHVILEFPDKEIYEAFTNALLDKGYVLDTNNQMKTVSYTKRDEKIITEVLNSIKMKYSTVIKDT